MILVLGKYILIYAIKFDNFSKIYVYFCSVNYKKSSGTNRQPQVQFDLSQVEDNISLGDSNNSNISSSSSSIGHFSLSKSMPSSPDTSFIIDSDSCDRVDFPAVDFDREAYRYIF